MKHFVDVCKEKFSNIGNENMKALFKVNPDSTVFEIVAKLEVIIHYRCNHMKSFEKKKSWEMSAT